MRRNRATSPISFNETKPRPRRTACGQTQARVSVRGPPSHKLIETRPKPHPKPKRQAKADRVAEIKRLNGAIAALQSELGKKEEALADCGRWGWGRVAADRMGKERGKGGQRWVCGVGGGEKGEGREVQGSGPPISPIAMLSRGPFRRLAVQLTQPPPVLTNARVRIRIQKVPGLPRLGDAGRVLRGQGGCAGAEVRARRSNAGRARAGHCHSTVHGPP